MGFCRLKCPVHPAIARRCQSTLAAGSNGFTSISSSPSPSSVLLPSPSSVLTPAAVKALVPSMQDLVLWKWDQVTVAMSGGVDSAVVLRLLSEMVSASGSTFTSILGSTTHDSLVHS